MNDVDRQTVRVVFLKGCADSVFLTDQHNRDTELSSRLDRALDFDCGRVIAAHRINCDFVVGHEELFLGRLDDFSFLIVAAMRTRAMRHPQFVAIRTFGE
jgi:hypothetical protein